MDAYEEPATWTPEPVRSRGVLALRFIGTVLFLPVLYVLWLAAVVVLVVVGTFTEAIASISTDRVIERSRRLPSWCVSWPELRHEGDSAYYRARVDTVVAGWTARASSPRTPKKTPPPVECAIPLRDYRAAGGQYVAQVALGQGWELRPTDVRKEVRLWWAAASHVD
ncbi:hypothetical protein [Streptomyces sp. NPDC051001]|uniref:hypothetical protein n=1 Tax=Streptomyces sp. NPDC051001 TaxID=3155795 RepID=UPI00341CC01A